MKNALLIGSSNLDIVHNTPFQFSKLFKTPQACFHTFGRPIAQGKWIIHYLQELVHILVVEGASLIQENGVHVLCTKPMTVNKRNIYNKINLTAVATKFITISRIVIHHQYNCCPICNIVI